MLHLSQKSQVFYLEPHTANIRYQALLTRLRYYVRNMFDDNTEHIKGKCEVMGYDLTNEALNVQVKDNIIYVRNSAYDLICKVLKK